MSNRSTAVFTITLQQQFLTRGNYSACDGECHSGGKFCYCPKCWTCQNGAKNGY